MAEDLQISTGTREERYQTLLPQLEGILSTEKDWVANMSNFAAALKEQFDWFWIGFYLVVSEDELLVGPFQGPVACTRIKKGRGVCGTSWQKQETVVVPDVEQFPGHIACSSRSRSEIVLPIRKDGKIIGVLDIDSEDLNSFSEIDQKWLEKMLDILVDASA